MTTAPPQEPFVFRPSAAHSRSRGGDPLVDQTRREISQMVREIATLAKQQTSIERFLSQLCDRTLRAMAAEGVVVWARTNDGQSESNASEPNASKHDSDISEAVNQERCNPFRPVCRLGRATDQNIPTQSLAAHQCMLTEVDAGAEPVVVPPTPLATEPDVPANPMEFPAAVVPIETRTNRDSVSYLIEVFLEPVGGIATQRGYLRFVAQVADLAGEFLRDHQLRTLIAGNRLGQQMEEAIESFETCGNSQQLRCQTVDQVAEMFQVDRVAWCDLTQKQPLQAVSHVDQFDPNSEAAKSITDAAWMDSVPHFKTSGEADEIDSDQNPDLSVIAVVDGGSRHPNQRLVLMRSVASRIGSEDSDASLTLIEHQQRELIRLTRHASAAAKRIDGSGIARLGWKSVQPKTEAGSLAWKLARSAFIATFVILILFIPVPNQILGTATTRPKSMQRIHASRDAIVQTIHVDHGDFVPRGQVLITLADPALEEQITSLQGRRAVLAEQQARLTQSMVDSPTANVDQFGSLTGQREITLEEIQSLDAQLKLLDSVRESLVLRADRSGTVDAWQLRQRLEAKPVRRGESLVGVISENSPWLLEVHVDQRRIGTLRSRHESGELLATATLDDQPDRVFQGSVVAFGPAATSTAKTGQTPSGQRLPQSIVLAELEQSSDSAGLINGAPAKIVFHCGSKPLAAKLFGDLWTSLSNQAALHLGIGLQIEDRQDVLTQ